MSCIFYKLWSNHFFQMTVAECVTTGFNLRMYAYVNNFVIPAESNRCFIEQFQVAPTFNKLEADIFSHCIMKNLRAIAGTTGALGVPGEFPRKVRLPRKVFNFADFSERIYFVYFSVIRPSSDLSMG